MKELFCLLRIETGTRRQLLLGFAGLTVLAGALMLIARTFTRPIEKLCEVSRELAGGNLAVGVEKFREDFTGLRILEKCGTAVTGIGNVFVVNGQPLLAVGFFDGFRLIGQHRCVFAAVENQHGGIILGNMSDSRKNRFLSQTSRKLG